MSAIVPSVVVPGFCGFIRESDNPPQGLTPTTLLESLWLSFVEGREGEPGSYLVALPEEGVLVRDLPPDGSLDALSRALPEHVEAGSLLCFAYDWRRDLTASAARLAAELVEHTASLEARQVDLIGVGVGALVVRYLLESGALPHVAALVRRTVLVAPPSAGIPAALLLLTGLGSVFDPGAAVREVVESFPAAVQLLPPRGASYLFLAGQPGVSLDPYSWPEAFATGVSARAPSSMPEDLMREVAGRNDALHGGLKTAFDPSWRQSLVFASASEPTYAQIHLRLSDGDVGWEDVERTPASGDGIVPIVGAVPSPMLRHFVVRGSHRGLLDDPGLRLRMRAFLLGPIS